MMDKIQIRNHSRFNGSEISAARIKSMLQTMEPEDIAQELGQPWPKLKAMLDFSGLGTTRRWAGRNNKTGRIITAYTERGIYTKAQLAGWTDWSYIDPATVAV